MVAENRSCRFKSDRAYPYSLEKEEVPINKNYISEFKEKVDAPQLFIQVMAEKMLILEAEVNTVKRVETH